jgi:hypothetical protein
LLLAHSSALGVRTQTEYINIKKNKGSVQSQSLSATSFRFKKRAGTTETGNKNSEHYQHQKHYIIH